MRPTFLTVLCVLTFIASGWGIYSAVSSYSVSESVVGQSQEALENAKDQMDEAAEKNPEGAETMNKIMDSMGSALDPAKIRSSAIFSGISSILALIGAILMWGLNKKGYYVYILGTVVSIIGPLVVYGGSLFGLIAAGGSIFIGILFCILYYLNVKHMS